MEVTKLVEGISDYIGTARNIPDREVSDTDGIRSAVGDPDDILGPIPSREEIEAETAKLDEMVREEMDDVDEVLKEPKTKKTVE